jgi:hypothetical protein
MKILGYDYKVILDDIVEDLGVYGRYHAKSHQIQIAKDLCEQEVVSSLLHETLEALNYHQGWGLEHNIIMSLESSLYQVLVDNGVDLKPLAKEILPKARR